MTQQRLILNSPCRYPCTRLTTTVRITTVRIKFNLIVSWPLNYIAVIVRDIDK